LNVEENKASVAGVEAIDVNRMFGASAAGTMR
jgi:hypothetical protein